VFRTEQGGELVVEDSPPGPALVCIRPDDVMIFRERPDGGGLRNLLPVKVSGVRPVGRHWRISLRWGDDEFDTVIDHDTHAGLSVRQGDQVWALVDASLEALPREGSGQAPAAEA
jgi:ABC-type molybdate transport system ATPase subunit